MEQRLRRLLLWTLVALGVLVGVSLVIAIALGGGSSGGSSSGSQPIDNVPRWMHEEHLPPSAKRGALVFAVSDCTTCHTYAGTGNSTLDSPDLTAIGSRHLGIAYEIAHLRCPSCVKPGSAMPAYAALGDLRLHELAVFLEASKGAQSPG